MTASLHMADLFCGAGGSSTGLSRACEEAGIELRLTAVNHWDVAIATHTANHPAARHWCMDFDRAKPLELVPEGRLKGGNDVEDQKRASAWVVPRMAEALRPRVIIVENVPPFRNWGPVEERDGRVRPIKARRGETFRAWFAAIESLGTRWFQRALAAAQNVLQFSRRLKFSDSLAVRQTANAPFPSALIGFGVSVDALADLGTIIVRRSASSGSITFSSKTIGA